MPVTFTMRGPSGALSVATPGEEILLWTGDACIVVKKFARVSSVLVLNKRLKATTKTHTRRQTGKRSECTERPGVTSFYSCALVD